MVTDVLENRRDRNHEKMLALGRFCALMLAIPAVFVGLVLGLLLKQPLLGGLGMLLVAGAAAAFMFSSLRSFGPRFIASLDPVPADETAHARLHNLTEGLCIANGINKPDLHVVDSDGLNVCTLITAGGPSPESALLVTSGMLDALSRVELEGVLAQQLGHLRDGDTSLSTFCASLVSVPVIGGFLTPKVRSALDPDLETWGDLTGVRITRYPPGLAAALEKMRDGSTVVVRSTARTAHLWLADPRPTGDGAANSTAEELVPHPPLGDRIAVLREL